MQGFLRACLCIDQRPLVCSCLALAVRDSPKVEGEQNCNFRFINTNIGDELVNRF